MLDKKTENSRASYAYVPRFRNVRKQETDFLRGYATTFNAGRGPAGGGGDATGEELKANLMKTSLGPWFVGSTMMGETIPKQSNTVSLDKDKKDDWDIPQLRFSIEFDDNDEKMIKDFFEQYTEMYTKAGFTEIKTSDSKQAPGLDIHEMGGARMGKDPKTSLLNGWNQLHACPNDFVTDGACMTSTSTQNPSLTYMALTARASNYAVELLKKGELK
jgi:choline dehydrogenase-like flavoprotein